MEKPQILVVEDEKVVAINLKTSLERIGYKVMAVVATGTDALQKIEKKRPDLAIIDIVLQGELDGIQTSEQILQKFDVPVIYCTSYSDTKILERAKKTEPLGYILKPFEDDELQSVIETALYKYQMENKLKESEERFRSLYENSTIGFYRTTPDGKILMANPALIDLLGFSSLEELSSRNLEEDGFEPSYPRREFKKLMKKNGEIRGLEAAWKRRDSSIIHVRESAKAFKDEKGHILYYEGTVEDVTDRHRVEEALKKSEERYRLLIEHANEIIAVAQDGKVRFINPQIEKIIGYSPEEVIDKDFLKFIHPEDREMVKKQFQRRIRGNAAPQSYNVRVIHRSRDIRWLRVNAVIITWEDKPATLAFLSDITELKQTEEALVESEKEYKSLYSMVRLMCDNVPDLIWAKDLKKRFIFANKAICEKLLNAKDTDEPIGKTDMYFANRERNVYPDNSDYHSFGEICRDSDSIVMKSKKPERFDEFGNVKGKFIFLDVYKAPFWDERGKMIGTVGCGRVVTKEKKLEEERKQFEKELIKSREVLRNLFANLQSVREEERTRISREIHDELGQALTALKMDLYWLNNKLPPDQKQLLKKTKSMLKLMDKTIQQVKKISSELRPGLLDDLGLVAAIEWQAGEFEDHTGINCKVSVKPEDIVIDPEKATAVFRIFQETLTNVARHAKATQVRVDLKEQNGDIVLMVKDNGIGIAKEQISNTKSLGLVGIKERVHSFKGDVKINGIPGKGTTLTVRIPSIH